MDKKWGVLSLILSVVSKGRGGHCSRGGFFCKLGSWREKKTWCNQVELYKINKLHLSLNDTNVQYQKCYSPVGNCEEANLVSRIPAPSINASRIPPMAAEPTIATGPSTEEQGLLMLHAHNTLVATCHIRSRLNNEVEMSSLCF